MNLRELDKKYLANTYARFPVNIVSGSGSLAYDDEGKTYIDMGSGIGVNAFGFCDEEWQRAIIEQIGLVQHTSNLFYTTPAVSLARMLCEKTGMSKVFFANSGAEVNECAIKVARKYAAERKSADCYNIVTLNNSFHGRTLTTLAATGQEHYHELFLPLTPGFLYADAEDLASVTKLISENKVAAIMIECVQGEGGVNVLSKAFVQALADLTSAQDILLIVDEIQTGNGRTGALYSYMNYGIKPDIFTTAKGLGGGLPIGACVLGEKVKDVLTPGDNGTTFGSNPVCCAAALSILSRLDDTLMAEVRAKSDYIFGELTNAPGIAGVSGMGLMTGIEPERKSASDIVAECIKNGVLCLTAKNKVRLLPALNIPMAELEKAIAVIKAAFAN